MTGQHISLAQVAGALALVGVAIAASFWRRADLEEDIAVAVVRSFVQLTAVGYVIKVIFDSDSLWLVVALLAFMVVFGAWTARARARGVPRAFVPLLLALGTAAAVTLGLVLLLNVFDPKPKYLVPVGGMVIGNAMTSASVALNRLADDIRERANLVEATLALGATSRQATTRLVSRSLRSGLIPLIDQTKTTGMVFFPGTMVGALLGGATPLAAVRLQLILLWTLMGAASLSALIATNLAQQRFFTPAHQLLEPPPP
ncbi:MAG TPA: iron export ABC transporter permease subunit FetB [Thermoleophilaceae bacterium]|jgi:putative ABC transport system permease protein|nr:iron export ABC transporter permease subunit FetB [Thermoleophilaceae bacterium]